MATLLRLRQSLLLILLTLVACQPAPSSPTAVLISPTTNPFSPTQALPTATFIPSFTPISTLTPTVVTLAPTPTQTLSPTPAITTLLFTGVIVPARCVQAALDAKGNPDYPYEEVSAIISRADIAIGTFNATMSDKVEHTGCIWTYQLVGSPQNADALARAGFDAMSVATNHIKDCGLMKSWCDYTFFDTLDNLHRVSIQTVGAGKNLDEALSPIVFTVNGVRFGIVSMGDSKLSETVFATENLPGIALLTEENMKAAIASAREVADVVIAMPHWGSEDIILPNWLQRKQAQYIVAAGADLVVGNHTHVIQAIQKINDILVFYGLGNFVFDQGLRDHRQGALLLVRFEGKRFIGYEIIPTHVDPDGRVHIADTVEASEILQRVERASDLLP